MTQATLRQLALLTLFAPIAIACSSSDSEGSGGSGFKAEVGGGSPTGTAGPGAGPGNSSAGPGSGGSASTTTGSSSGGSGTGGMSSGSGGQGSGIFSAPNAWTTPVDGSAKSPDSDAITNWLAANGGWGTGTMRIDFSIEVLTADASAPMQDFIPTGDFFDPDCDQVPFPVPPGGALEGETGYACDSDGDCHLIVVHQPSNKLYEMWRANIQGSTFYGGCAAVWDLGKTYPDNLRGEGCSSADAGGFPIAAMLFSADEVAAGEIAHAIRFIIPNARIRDNVYVHPGTHSTGPTSGGPDAPPYGVRMRLRADFPLDTLPSDGARVIAKGLQKYGMFLADAGNIALTGQSDQFTQAKWSDVDVDSYALDAIQPTDMEVVEMGAPIDWSGDCIRNP